MLGLAALVLLGLMALRNIRSAPTRLDKALAAGMMAYALLSMVVDAMRLVSLAFAFGLSGAHLLRPRRVSAGRIRSFEARDAGGDRRMSRGTPAAASPKPELLFIGNFLSAAGASRGVCEDLVERLRGAGWQRRAPRPTSSPRCRGCWTWPARSGADAAGTRSSTSTSSAATRFSGPRRSSSCSAAMGKTHVLTLHGGSLPEFSARWPVRGPPDAVRRRSAVTVPSEFLRREMRPYRSDLRLLPNPLDLSAYPYRRRERPEPRLVWLRAFHETYNPSLAPRVLALLVRDDPAATLTMIGPDRGDGSLARARARAADLGVLDRVQFPARSPKSSVGEHLSRGDIFVNTTNVDNAPVSVLEAMACGLCVVSTRVGGIPDLVRDGEEGLLVPPDDAEAMVAAIRRVLREPELAARLSAGGRLRARSTDWNTVLPQWEELLTAANGAAALAEGPLEPERRGTSATGASRH